MIYSEKLSEVIGNLGVSGWFNDVVTASILALINLALLGLVVVILVYMERKVSADIQVRYGPLHVGPHGVL